MGELLARRIRQISFGLVLVAAGLGPLAPTIEATFALRLIVNMFFVLAGALWVLSMALAGRMRLRRTGMAPWLLLFFGAILAATVNASYKYPAVLTGLGWVAGMIGFAYVVNEARTRRARLLLLSVIGASALVVALHGVHQRFIDFPEAMKDFRRDPEGVLRRMKLPPDVVRDFEGRLLSNRVYGSFVSPNSLAGFLVLVIPACAGLLMDRAARRGRVRPSGMLISGCALLLPMGLALYLTKSKGGWLAFGAAGGAFVVWAFWAEVWRRRVHVLCGVLTLLVVGLVAQKSKLLPPLRDYLGSSQVRYGYWRAGLLIAERRWHTGVGLNNFADRYARHKRAVDQESRHVHNDYIQIAAEMGLLGLILYAGLWARFWRRVQRREGEPIFPATEAAGASEWGLAQLALLAVGVFALEALCGGTFLTSEGASAWWWLIELTVLWMVFVLVNAHSDDDPGPVRHSYATVGMGCGLIGFMAHSAVDFDHYIGGTVQTAWLMMGLLLAARLSEERDDRPIVWRMGPVARLGTVVAAAGVSLAVLHGFVLPASVAYNAREQAMDTSVVRSVEAEKLRGRAQRLEAEADRPGADRPGLRLRAQALRLHARRVDHNARREDLETAIKSNPWEAHTYALLSDLHVYGWRTGYQKEVDGVSSLSRAIVAIGKAIRLCPARSEYYTRLGRLYELRWRRDKTGSDYVAAIEAYQRAEEFFPSNPDTALNLGRLYDLKGRHKLALGKYLRARVNSEEQYHVRRKIRRRDKKELEERIEVLKPAVTDGTAVPPLNFTQPRLLGWPNFTPPPERKAPGGSDKGSKGAAGQGA